MAPLPYEILDHKRRGLALSEAEIAAAVAGATAESGAPEAWTDAQLGAFLMASVIRGLDPDETRALTLGMLRSGEQWDLAAELPGLLDKHSTGGVGDKVSLVLGPLLAAVGRRVVMLTGRGLGHTGGTADKLEAIPGLDQALDRARCRELLGSVGLALGLATADIAPADRRLYALRDATATVESLPLITASILSKKLASGAAAIVFDVKTGSGAFLRERSEARELARLLVDTCAALGRSASALVTDMSQPLGEWAGHDAELKEALACLEGSGPAEVEALAFALAEEVTALAAMPVSSRELAAAIASGAARERFDRWAVAQGGDRAWLAVPRFELAPVELVVEAERDGVLAAVETRRLGLLLVAAGAGRRRPHAVIDRGVSLWYRARLGQRVERGQELARLYLRRPDLELEGAARGCFAVEQEGAAPPLIYEARRAG